MLSHIVEAPGYRSAALFVGAIDKGSVDVVGSVQISREDTRRTLIGIVFWVQSVLPASEGIKLLDGNNPNKKQDLDESLTYPTSIHIENGYSWNILATILPQLRWSLFLVKRTWKSYVGKNVCHANPTKATSNHRHLRDPSMSLVATF
jgi:hypothetical protein